MMPVDRSYRMLILLQRSDREKYWDFHCPRCQALITQVNNAYVQSMADTVDLSNDYGHAITCPSRYCRIKYYFVFND